MFQLYKPFNQLTQAQQESARGWGRRLGWSSYTIRYRHVYQVRGDFIDAAYPMKDYLAEFAENCPECRGELSMRECLDHAYESSIVITGSGWKATVTEETLDAIHETHCLSRKRNSGRVCKRCFPSAGARRSAARAGKRSGPDAMGD